MEIGKPMLSSGTKRSMPEIGMQRHRVQGVVEMKENVATSPVLVTVPTYKRP